MKSASKTVSVNGRDYRWPKAPLVVICCDGSEPDYMEIAMAEGLMPNLKKMIAGAKHPRTFASFKLHQPHNLSIVTALRLRFTALRNYLIDPVTGLETMMNDPKWLRAPTISKNSRRPSQDCHGHAAKQVAPLLGKGLVLTDQPLPFLPSMLTGDPEGQWY